MLTEAQQDAVLLHLHSAAQATLDYINRATGGVWHRLISGDTGGGERTMVRVVLEDTIPRLQADAERARNDAADAATWTETARAAERDLAVVAGYAQVGTVDQILVDTASATAVQARDLADQAAKAVALAIPWYVYAAAGALLWLELRPATRGV